MLLHLHDLADSDVESGRDDLISTGGGGSLTTFLAGLNFGRRRIGSGNQLFHFRRVKLFPDRLQKVVQVFLDGVFQVSRMNLLLGKGFFESFVSGELDLASPLFRSV